ncbi:hypothetical protein [Haladaptatus sp. NG-SE-30]
MPRPGASTTALIALLVLALVSPVQAVALSPTTGSENVATQGDHLAQTATPSNNSSVQHENPDDVQTDGDLSELERWLAGRLSSQLGGSTIQLSQGEYQKARSIVGDDYNDMLGKYVDVAGETEGTQDDKTAKTFKQTQQNQQQFVSRVQQYRTLHDRYQQAKRNGNDDKARQIARRLEQLERDINQSSGNLTANYNTISNGTDADFERETQTVQNITQNISTQQATVRESEFVQTTLTATARSEDVSFLDPFVVTGRLTTENGTELANKSVQITVEGQQTQRVQTDSDGEFSIYARPTTVSLGNQSFRIEYLPENDSVYLGSNKTVHANVTQVPSTVSIGKHTTTSRFNETVSVSGSVQAGGVRASNVPIAIFVGQTRIGTTHTTEDGTFSFRRRLPPNAPVGAQAVRVTVPLQNKALASSSTTAPLTIESTATNLTLTGTPGNKRSVELSGQLHTADGTPIANQRVAILVSGTQLTSVRTNENGSYRVTLVLPSNLVADEGDTTFVTKFDGPGSNLESARTSTALAVGSDEPLDQETRGWIVSFGIAALITLSGYLLWRSDVLASIGLGRSADNDGVTATDSGMAGATPGAQPSDSSSSSAVTQAFLDHARSAFEAGDYEKAVESAYSAARHRFTSTVSKPTSTHWEFYNACREANLSDEMLSTLGDVTERYEQAAFSTKQVTREATTTVIDDVAGLLPDDRSTD